MTEIRNLQTSEARIKKANLIAKETNMPKISEQVEKKEATSTKKKAKANGTKKRGVASGSITAEGVYTIFVYREDSVDRVGTVEGDKATMAQALSDASKAEGFKLNCRAFRGDIQAPEGRSALWVMPGRELTEEGWVDAEQFDPKPKKKAKAKK